MESTAEERERVTRDRCRGLGHSFDVILVHQYLAPQVIVCTYCGSSWQVKDNERDFGKRSYREEEA